MRVSLTKLAHARSGDKGDTANIGLIALRQEYYPVLVREVTAARVKEHFDGICKGNVERFELPNLGALNFLLHESLGGGGTLALMELFNLIRQVRVPVIAAVKGRALAGGCGLATACDLVLAARSARFGYPEVRIGFVPAMVMAMLRRNVSEKRAFELVTLGSEITAEEALTLGLINRVFDDKQFDDQVEAFARLFEKVSRSAVSLSKK